jgi:hypothetical protein
MGWCQRTVEVAMPAGYDSSQTTSGKLVVLGVEFPVVFCAFGATVRVAHGKS